MFSSKLTRVANRATTITNASPVPAQWTASQCFATTTQRRPHQRRQSSSKTSCPPDSSSSKPAPAAKAAESTEKTASEEKTPRRTSRLKRTQVEKSVKGKEEANQFAGLPTVPDTRHVAEKDFWLSTFFSLHHPLSLNNPLPPPASEETFNSIFESRPQLDVWENGNSAEQRPEDVIIALQETIENLEGNNSAAQEEANVRWEVLQESASNGEPVKHLDGPPKPRTIDDLVTQFKPFQAPPPPEPFPVETKASEKKRARTAKPKSKSYQTTIVVTESTAADGHRTYTASQSPLVQIANAKENNTLNVNATTRQPRQPFLQRAWRKHQAHLQSQRKTSFSTSANAGNALRSIRRAPGLRKPQMRLISVKRQRKLKMKKHKYKKLMKRTRNLRRRLDRN